MGGYDSDEDLDRQKYGRRITKEVRYFSSDGLRHTTEQQAIAHEKWIVSTMKHDVRIKIIEGILEEEAVQGFSINKAAHIIVRYRKLVIRALQ